MKWVQSQGTKDCGAACLATVALRYGVRVDVHKVAILAQTTRQGARLDRLRDAAGVLGFAASCGRLKPDQFASIPLPAIAHIERTESDHYVVIVKRNAKTVWAIDPSIGPIRKSISEFQGEFSGFVLLLSPNRGFEQLAAEYSSSTSLGLMWSVIKADVALFTLALLSALVAASAALVGPYFLQLLFDQAQFQLDFGIILFTQAAVIRALLAWIRYLCSAALGRNVERASLSQFLEVFPKSSMEMFDRCPPADLVVRVSDSATLRAAVTGPLLGLGLDVAYLVVSSVIVSRVGWRLSIIILFSVVSATAVHLYLRPRQMIYSRQARVSGTELTGSVLEAIVCARTIKTFGRESVIADKLKAKHGVVLRSAHKAAIYTAWSTAGGMLLSGLGISALVYAAQHLMDKQDLTRGALAYVIGIAMMMMNSIENIASAVSSIEDASLSASRLLQATSPENGYETPRRSTLHSSACSESLVFRNVSFSYPNSTTPILTGLFLTVSRGQVIGIRGESGSGKSTFATLCNGLYMPSAGEIRIFDRQIQEWNLTELRENVAVVYSDNNLLSGTVWDNITLGCEGATEAQVVQACRAARAHEFISSLPRRYLYQLGYGGFGLSSGQKQRLAIARALLVKPTILILDEATSNLDVDTEGEVLRELLNDRVGLTTVIISHRPETLRHVHHTFEMSGGQFKQGTSSVEGRTLQNGSLMTAPPR